MKKLVSLAAALLLLLPLAAPASADIAGSEPCETELGFDYYIGCEHTVDEMLEAQREMLEKDRGKSLSEIATEHDAILWHFNPYGEEEPPAPQIEVKAGQSWEDAVKTLFEKYDIYEETNPEHTGRISLGYYNTVTGEEHYHSGDEYLISASMFKIPENMIFSDRIKNGKMSMDTVIYDAPYSFYQYRTISQSDNQRAWDLFNYLGGYNSFKTLQKEYLGSDPEEVLGWEYYNDNYYNAKQIVNCLKLIWNDQDRFNGILQNMLQANPYEYFKMFQRDYPVAQKYGFVEQTETNGSNTYINCCGIIFTDEPIILVVFTDNLSKGYDVIGEYASLMSTYAQLNKTAAENENTAEENTQEETEQQAEITAAAENISIESNTEETKKDIPGENNMTSAATFIMVLVLAAMVLALVFISRRNKGARINTFWAVVAIVIAAAAMILCIFALNVGSMVSKTSGNPQDAVSGFFDAAIEGNYEKAATYLENYSSLGIEPAPDTEEGKAILEALRSSWSYTLRGEPQIDKLSATQKVAVRYLDLAGVEADAESRVDDILNGVVQSRPREEVYDESNQYLESVTDEVYRTAVAQALENAESHYSSREVDIEVHFTDGKWKMVLSPELLNLLLGGVS